jgi:hypothetical protein
VVALAVACQEQGSIAAHVEGPELRLDGEVTSASRRVTACPGGVFLESLESAELLVRARAWLSDGQDSTVRVTARLRQSGTHEEEAPVGPGTPVEVDVELSAYPGLGLGEVCSEGVSVSFEQSGGSTIAIEWLFSARFFGSKDDIDGCRIEFDIFED